MEIARFYWQSCIGYNQDFTRTYYKGFAQMKDGSMKMLYSTTTKRTTVDGYTFDDIGDWTPSEPYVAKPVHLQTIITQEN